MAFINEIDLSESRPPPKRQRSIQITTPGIPWYRDLRILHVIAQIVFAFVFIGGLIGLFANLTNNLNESNLTLDFGIYKSPFTVAITEGPSLTSDWGWIEKTDTIETVAWVIYLGTLTVTGYLAYRNFQKETFSIIPYVIGVFALLMLFTLPPSEVPGFFGDYFYGGSMSRAFVTGAVNTLRVVILSLIACTILGIFVGIGLLSKNVLVRGVSRVFVEIFRNTPLIIQLLFIYRTLTLLLPFPRQSIYSPSQIGPLKFSDNLYALNARGLYFASPSSTDKSVIMYAGIVAAIFAFWIIRRWRAKRQEATGEPAYILRYTLPAFFGLIILAWLIAGGWPLGGDPGPFTMNYPSLQGPNITGGTKLSIGFFSLFAGLTLYTAAFIAEIVRAGIQSVPYGQIEAARSQGLSGSQVLNLVVLPQALRLIIPPLGNQYVNLGKNSSLAIVVTYTDLYRVAQLANNESGQAVPFFAGLMVLYLILSVTLSFLTNLVNRSTRIRTR
jgi:general L-amino acid transport system permease protein